MPCFEEPSVSHRDDLAPSLSRLLDNAAGSVLTMRSADVGASREVSRRRRWIRLAAVVLGIASLVSWRASVAPRDLLPLPHVDPFLLTIIVFFGLMLLMAVGQQFVSARSPHVTYRPEQIETTLADVVGIDGVKEDVVRSLNLFLAHKTFS